MKVLKKCYYTKKRRQNSGYLFFSCLLRNNLYNTCEVDSNEFQYFKHNYTYITNNGEIHNLSPQGYLETDLTNLFILFF